MRLRSDANDRLCSRMIEVPADEIEIVANQLRLEPPDDGRVQLDVTDDGSLVATWTSDSRPCSVGPSTGRPLP